LKPDLNDRLKLQGLEEKKKNNNNTFMEMVGEEEWLTLDSVCHRIQLSL